MITSQHNYDNGYICLVHIDVDNLPPVVTVGGQELLLKSEHHISLICAKRVAALIDSEHADEVEAKIVQLFTEFAKTHDLGAYKLLDEYRLVSKDERKTIVRMANVPGVEEFFDLLRQRFAGATIPTQPLHVTLYTLQPEVGIGILSTEELETISNPITLPDLSVST